MSFVNPAHAISGPSLFILEESRFQSTLLSEEKSKTAAIVLSLVEPLLGKEHTLWMDNFYNAPTLAITLQFLKTDCVGTLCLNRKDLTKIVNEKKLRKGEI
jgi:hypothetical protein